LSVRYIFPRALRLQAPEEVPPPSSPRAGRRYGVRLHQRLNSESATAVSARATMATEKPSASPHKEYQMN